MYDPTEFLSTVFGGNVNNPNAAGVDAYGKNMAGAMAQGVQGLGSAGMGLVNSYVNEYQPYDRKLMGYVDSIGTDAYRAQQRGRAMTDVGIQAGQQMQAVNRNMGRMGVNPNSAQFAMMNGQMAQQNALAKVMAAMGADRGAREEWAKGLGAISATGLKVGELGMRNMETAGNLGRVGLAGADLGASANDRNINANANTTSAGAAATNASTNAARLAQDGKQFDQNYGLNLGRLALDRYLGDRQWNYNDRALDNKIEAGSLGNTFASQVGGALATGVGTGLVNAGKAWIGDTFKNGGGYTYQLGDANMPAMEPAATGGIPGLDAYQVHSDGYDYFFQ